MPIKSKSISCLIIDDELSSQSVLQHFVLQTDILHLKQICNNAKDAFKYLQLNTKIDLLFLDINMPNQSGLAFYKSLQNPPKVIFTTAYPQYAVDGFDLNAVDYLLKPFSYERFLTAVNKIITLNSIAPETTDFILLKENKILHKVFFNDIQYIEAFGDYVKVHSKEKIVVTHSTFKKMTKNLPDYFLRVHKSFTINTTKIKALSGNQILIDTHNIPIGQTYKENVLKALNF
jgi:DNA-binding LytR/AlgR family response regulator